MIYDGVEMNVTGWCHGHVFTIHSVQYIEYELQSKESLPFLCQNMNSQNFNRKKKTCLVFVSNLCRSFIRSSSIWEQTSHGCRSTLDHLSGPCGLCGLIIYLKSKGSGRAIYFWSPPESQLCLQRHRCSLQLLPDEASSCSWHDVKMENVEFEIEHCHYYELTNCSMRFMRMIRY